MLEILKRAGIASGIATVVVLAITVVPLYLQFKTAAEQNARIQALEAKVTELEKK